MVSGADVRVALEAGLWKTLVGSCDRAAMRSSCSDAMAMADMLHDTAVLPVGPGTLIPPARIAAYHRRLGTVQALHVWYGASDAEDADEEDALQFMEAYSAELGTALPATHCVIDVAASRQLPPPFAAVLLQRVVPGLERLDMALGSYRNQEQVLQALEPCTRLRALRLLPASSQRGAAVAQHRFGVLIYFNLRQEVGVLGALCKLAHLHTLSGPWRIGHDQLKRLCDALPSLTTLGFHQLDLRDPPCACISRQLHTLAAWDGAAGAGAACITGISAVATALPAVQQLKGVSLDIFFSTQAQVLAVRDAVQRCAACADGWTLRVGPKRGPQHAAQGLPAGCLAPLQHLELDTSMDANALYPADVADMLGCLLSAAPSLATVTLEVYPIGWNYVVMVRPLRQAAHLHTLRIVAIGDHWRRPEQAASLLERVVRCLTQPGAEGEGAPCRALQRVLLRGMALDALQACRRALEADGIAVRVDTY